MTIHTEALAAEDAFFAEAIAAVDFRNPRTWSDEMIDEAFRLGVASEALVQESQRRAEIRLVRAEYGKFNAAWYAPRPLYDEIVALAKTIKAAHVSHTDFVAGCDWCIATEIEGENA